MYPRLLIVPVDTSVLLTCEVCYNGPSAYSVWLHTESVDLETINLSWNEVNNSTLNYTLSIKSEYKNMHITCQMVSHDRNDNVNGSSDSTILNAISEGKCHAFECLLLQNN